MSEILQEPVTAEAPDISGFIMKDGTPGHTGTGPSPETGPEDNDRPGWIPPEILHNWDTDPYAYQTEEELMPAGGPHGELLGYIMGISQDFLAEKNMKLLMDVFMLYRDSRGKKQRVGPDLLLMPFRSDAPSAYDLDTDPPPLFVAEVTSPDSREDDMGKKPGFYDSLGIPACLVIDRVTSRGKPRKKLGLHLWRKQGGIFRRVKPGAGGWLEIPEMGVKIKAEGKNPVFADIVTGEILQSAGKFREKARKEEALRKQEEVLRKQEAERARKEEALRKQEEVLRKQEAERARKEEALRKQETERADRLAAKLRELGISPDEL